MRVLFIRGSQHLAFIRSGGREQTLVVHAGNHVGEAPVAVFRINFGIKGFNPGGQDYSPDFNLGFSRLLPEIDGISLTDAAADIAFFIFQIKAAVINVSN